METEKTSYTLNHTEEENDENKNESYEPIEEEPAVETDKMLSKDLPLENESKVADESTVLEQNGEAVEDKPNSIPPAKNRFFKLFERKKTKPEPAETPLNGTAVTELDATIEQAPKKRFIPLKLQNPFAKKSETATPDKPEKPTIEATNSDEKKGKNSHQNGDHERSRF